METGDEKSVDRDARACSRLTAGMAAAQDKAATEKALIANEHKINDGGREEATRPAFNALVAPDAWSADGNGFMKVSDFSSMMEQLKVTTWKISRREGDLGRPEHRHRDLQMDRRRHLPGPAVAGQTYVSTVWTKKGDAWLAVYHQESEAAKPPAPKPAAKKK